VHIIFGGATSLWPAGLPKAVNTKS
jgi:hypothetical protein